MIGFFPDIYPDELLYSLIARYHKRTGYTSYKSTFGDIYIKREICPDFDFLNRYNSDALKWITKNTSMEDLILNHTMFPAYARFIPAEKRNAAFNLLLNMESGWHNKLALPKSSERNARYCPICAKEDRERYGETYWHRIHQIRKLRICPVHGCFLKDSSLVTLATSSHSLIDAETCVPADSEPQFCKSEIEKKLAEYIRNVFFKPIVFEDRIQVGFFLNSRLRDIYKNGTGLLHNMSLLFTDYCKKYSDIEVMEEYVLSTIFNGTKCDMYYICQLGLFEDISPEELSDLPKKEKIFGIDLLYRKLAEQYGVEQALVEKIGDDIVSYTVKNISQRNYTRRKAYIKGELDEKMLPEVIRLVDNAYLPSQKPQKVSYKSIERQLKLPEKSLANGMPECKDYIDAHLETQTEFWAREIVWAVNELRKQNAPVNKSRIVGLTFIEYEKLPYCVPDIKDEEIKKLVIGLLKK